jgi:hypothetical protein
MPKPAQTPEPLHVRQPDDHPQTAELTIPATFVPRFRRIKRLVRGKNAPADQHVAAAVLFDSLTEEPDAAAVRLARRMGAADRHIRSNPGTPVVTINKARVQVGITAPNSGLFARDSPVSLWRQATLIIPCTSLVSAAIYGSFWDSPELEPIDENSGAAQNLNSGATRYVITPRSVGDVGQAKSWFLPSRGGALLVGDEAISTFFDPASRDAGYETGKNTQRVVALATEFLAQQKGFKSLLGLQ